MTLKENKGELGRQAPRDSEPVQHHTMYIKHKPKKIKGREHKDTHTHGLLILD